MTRFIGKCPRVEGALVVEPRFKITAMVGTVRADKWKGRWVVSVDCCPRRAKDLTGGLNTVQLEKVFAAAVTTHKCGASREGVQEAMSEKVVKIGVNTLTKKQQLVLCAMYVESLGEHWNTQAFKSWDKQIVISLNPRFTCSQNTINYLQSYGLVGSLVPQSVNWLYYNLTPDGEELAEALFAVLS